VAPALAVSIVGVHAAPPQLPPLPLSHDTITLALTGAMTCGLTPGRPSNSEPSNSGKRAHNEVGDTVLAKATKMSSRIARGGPIKGEEEKFKQGAPQHFNCVESHLE
jgi:hypothetical protein